MSLFGAVAALKGVDLDFYRGEVLAIVGDNGLLLRYSNGARGSMWVTNAAAGAEHGLT